jgi:hypothetical protein
MFGGILALRLDQDIDLCKGMISVTRNVEEIHVAKGDGDKESDPANRDAQVKEQRSRIPD